MKASQKAAMLGIANGLASPNASRPVCLGRSPDSRVERIPADRTFPCRRHSGFCGLTLAYRCVGSAGFASAWMRTGFPFHPRGSDDPWDT